MVGGSTFGNRSRLLLRSQGGMSDAGSFEQTTIRFAEEDGPIQCSF